MKSPTAAAIAAEIAARIEGAETMIHEASWDGKGPAAEIAARIEGAETRSGLHAAKPAVLRAAEIAARIEGAET